jgi:hypothetical protein
MKTIFYIILLISFSLQLTFAQGNIQSAGRVPNLKIARTHTVVVPSDNPASIAYGWSSINSNTLSMPIPAGTPFTFLAPWTSPVFASSMVNTPANEYYITEVGPPAQLYQFDPATGAVTLVGNITGMGSDQPNGIAYNPANSTYYICSRTNLYSFNLITRVATLVGPFNAGGLMIDLCFDIAGTCYAYDINTDNGYTINLTSGNATILGPLGYNANYGQGMSYDYETNTIYLSAFNNTTLTAQLRTMNPQTGTTTLITDWGFEQIAPFAIDSNPNPCIVGQASNPNPPNGTTGVPLTGNTLTWTNGNGTVDVEVWFGSIPNIVKVYDGPAISSYPLITLDYGTTYGWRVACKNDTCTTCGPTWSFTTMEDPNLIFDTIHVYPQNMNYWTGTCNSTFKTQVSLVNGYYQEVGWMVFDLSGIPASTIITDIEFNGYLYANNWPYWSITPMEGVNPVTADAATIYNQIVAGYTQGTAYSFNQEPGTLVNGWISRELGNDATNDLQSALSEGWFAIGIVDWDFSTSYYVDFQGWAESNEPYLVVTFDWCLSCLPPNPPSNLTAQVIFNPSPQVQLNWQDNSYNEYGFKIYRKYGSPSDPGNYFVIDTVFTNITQFIDTSVLPESTYTYRVFSFNPYGQNGSNTATIAVPIPVELISFTSEVEEDVVTLFWQTVTETNNSGFEVERSQMSKVKSQTEWQKLGFVEGKGTTTEIQSYSFTDKPEPGKYKYRLKQIDFDGSFEYSSEIETEVKAPNVFSLEQNYPNPFNPSTMISYQLAVNSNVTLKVYDVLGNEVATLVDEYRQSGKYEVDFNSSSIKHLPSSGIYFYQLRAGSFVETKKMVLLK